MAFPFNVVLPILEIGFDIFGGEQEREGIEAESESEQAVLRFNAAQNRIKAERVRKAGAAAEFEIRRETRERQARNVVAGAAAGVIPRTGTQLEAELMMVRESAGNIATLEENVRLQAKDLETLAAFQLEQAADVRRAASRAKKTSLLGDIGNILGRVFEPFGLFEKIFGDDDDDDKKKKKSKSS